MKEQDKDNKKEEEMNDNAEQTKGKEKNFKKRNFKESGERTQM